MEELINALKVIKKTCDDQERCTECPLSKGEDDCLIIIASPSSWDIQKKPIQKVLL
ncbi:hypothetical protein [Clostridium cadaveris]|uniref:hypothetical protein n=1 Tax=Clostridium cadaveris TaxID=1529 RepID=UPI000428BFFC|nr:hypothetical protein [Clostridium cadaveris]NME64440.1 hypothetical protein [Clostridium cadaveris]